MKKECRILVTGGAGFIGSNLVDALLMRGCAVTVLDNFSTGKRANLAHLSDNSDFTLIEGDIRNMDDCRKALNGVSYVLHEAALGSVPRSVKDPVTTTEVNVLGFVNMLYAAKEAGVKRFVYASSSSVYGDNPALPKFEDKTGKPLSPYAITKCTNELYAQNFHDLFGIDTIGLRYFNVFGQRQDPESAYAAVIPAFARNLLYHESPLIHGDGTHSRDFTYVENVLQMNLLALFTEQRNALNQVYNVACGEQTDLNRLFEMLRSNLSVFDPAIANVQPKYGADRAGDIPHSLADISKAVKILGYNPQFDVSEGLKETASWYYRNLK